MKQVYIYDKDTGRFLTTEFLNPDSKIPDFYTDIPPKQYGDAYFVNGKWSYSGDGKAEIKEVTESVEV